MPSPPPGCSPRRSRGWRRPRAGSPRGQARATTATVSSAEPLSQTISSSPGLSSRDDRGQRPAEGVGGLVGDDHDRQRRPFGRPLPLALSPRRSRGAMIGAMARCFVTRELPGEALGRLAGEHEVDVWEEDRPIDRDGPARARRSSGGAALHARRPDRRRAPRRLPGPAGHRQLRRRGRQHRPRRDREAGAARRQHARRPHRDDRRPRLRPDPRLALAGSSAPPTTCAPAAGRTGDRRCGSAATSTARRSGSSAPARSAAPSPAAARASAWRSCSAAAPPAAASSRSMSSWRGSDFVSVHCPLTEETRGLIGERALRSMKATAFLINTARGRDRRLGCAATGARGGLDRRRRPRRHRPRAAAAPTTRC